MNKLVQTQGRNCVNFCFQKKNVWTKSIVRAGNTMNSGASTQATAMPSLRTTTLRQLSTGSDIMKSFGSKDFEGNNVASAMEALANADAVCFDVDSTVIQEEGIDVLAASLGKGEEVSAWTKKAMEGNTKFEDALAARLDIIKPSRSSIEKCLNDNPLQLSPGIERLVETLSNNGVDVYLVSGGFRSMIEPIAKTLCVSKTNIIANTIFFDERTPTGEYTGFCRDEPTSADMGKPKAVQQIKDKHGYTTVVMVGDGATDAQAKPPADAFIGFGGVVVREAVKEKACWFVRDFDSMTAVIENFGKNKLKK
mmetsp:Transcript_22007/g.26964  ORF Transcript_22007/g.26964 Transcript_22007/m.26964 type:complete len:309 (+) Transcript_22007:95-1021(+)